jgi:hypothetical protein
MTKPTDERPDERVTFREMWAWAKASSLHDIARVVPMPCGGRGIRFEILNRPVTLVFDKEGFLCGHE